MNYSDRIKNYISDYLEHSLDPSTQKEFEDALENLSGHINSEELKMTIISINIANYRDFKKFNFTANLFKSALS